jgi:peptidoglycan/xylan/chitin deacetylase (PgdA/CDA1 family)
MPGRDKMNDPFDQSESQASYHSKRSGVIGRVLNRSADLLFFNRAFEGFWLEKLRGKVSCLLYHRIDDPKNNLFLTSGGSPVTAPGDFEAEINYLKDKGAVFLTFADLREGRFPSQSQAGFIISFDDCFADNYGAGLEILERSGVKAVFFQTTGMIGAEDLIWEHALYWYMRDAENAGRFTEFAHRRFPAQEGIVRRSGRDLLDFLVQDAPVETAEELLAAAKEEFGTGAELKEIARRIYPAPRDIQRAYALGSEIGSHGHHHYKRGNIDELKFERELRLSSDAINTVTGARPAAFSYPFSSYFEADKEICRKCFSQAATVHHGPGGLIDRTTDPYWIPRFTWPGRSKTLCRRRRWLLTGAV